MKKLILLFTILTFFIGNTQQDKPSGYHKDGILFDDAQTPNVETLWYNSFTNQYGIIRYDRVAGKFRVLENGTWKDLFGTNGISNILQTVDINATTYTLQEADILGFKQHLIDSGQTNVTITIPELSYNLSTDEIIYIFIYHEGAGDVTVEAGANVTFSTTVFSDKNIVLYSDADNVWKVKEVGSGGGSSTIPNNLTLGIPDDTSGSLIVAGDDTNTSGSITIENPASYDTDLDDYVLRTLNGNLILLASGGVNGSSTPLLTFNSSTLQTGFGNYEFPRADGTAGQVLTTDGSGQVTFEDISLTSSDNYRVNVLDFFDSDALRDDVINRNPAQNIAETTEAITEAVQYCIDNDVRELVFGNGLYITNRILFSDTDNFSIIGEGSTLQYNSNTSIFQFVNCDNVTISGFEFTSILASDLEVYFLRIQNNNSYFKIFNNRFTNFPRNAIIADNLSGGTYTEGITVYMNEFVDSPNYSNPLQAAIALGEDGEYSKVINNNFYNVPSAVRFIDGANGLFAYNNVLNCNGDAYGVGYDNAIVYSEFNTNSAKLDVVYNKINHNPTGIPAIVIKGDPTKPQNACKIQGNDVLVHGSTSKSMAFYIKDAPYTIITDNKIRGNSGTPNDNAIYIEDSNEIHLDKNYISYYNNGVNVVNSTDIFYGENSFTDITTDNYVVDASSNVLKSTNYGGDWNASTNTPTLANTDTNVMALEYRVSAAGSVDFGAGSISFSVGDIVANNGNIWYKKVDNDQSSGVAGVEEAPNDGTKYVRQNEGWVAESTGSSGILTAVKTADETKTEDDTVSLDSDLQITLEANSYYDIEVQLLYTAGGVPDFRTQFEVPSGSDGIWWRIINDDTFGLTELTTVTSHNGLGTTTEAYVRFFVNIYTDSTSGTFGVKWAQNSSSTIITTLQKGSSIKAVKLN